MSHTPGPWRVHQHDQINGELWLSIGFHTHDGTADPDGRWIGPVAELKYLIAREDEQRANANLIAAAPDLLSALRMCRAIIGSGSRGARLRVEPEAIAQADAAIAKAEG